MRGLYCWSEALNGIETWYARVDRSAGEWETLSAAEYKSLGASPTFDDLPLREDYLQGLIANNGGTS